MAWEHDQVVRPRQLRSRCAVELAVAEHVDLLPRSVKPTEEGEVIRSEAERDTTREVGARRLDCHVRPIRVPAVADAVPVSVADVVGQPGVGGKHDRDAVLSQPPGSDDEGREADVPAARPQPREVQPARPVADLDPEGRATVHRPEGDFSSDLDSEHHVAATGDDPLRAGAEHANGHPANVGEKPEDGRLSGPVALALERRLDGAGAIDELLVTSRDSVELLGELGALVLGVHVVAERAHSGRGDDERQGHDGDQPPG